MQTDGDNMSWGAGGAVEAAEIVSVKDSAGTSLTEGAIPSIDYMVTTFDASTNRVTCFMPKITLANTSSNATSATIAMTGLPAPRADTSMNLVWSTGGPGLEVALITGSGLITTNGTVIVVKFNSAYPTGNKNQDACEFSYLSPK